jgi:hypothetical protein
MTRPDRTPAFRWDLNAGLATCVAAILCLIPTIGFLAAWHMHADLPGWTRWATLPALLALAAVEYYLVRRHPVLFNRFAAGLVGGVAAMAALDLVRLPFAWLAKGAPDWVPLIGQHLAREPIGIMPTTTAATLGYGYHYLLVGALVGATYSLLVGKGRWHWALIAGGVVGLAFSALPQARLLAVATGFDPMAAGAVWMAGFLAAGAVLGLVVQRLGRTTTNALYVVFLREEPLEVPELAGVRRS